MSAIAQKNLVIPAGSTWSQIATWKTGDPPVPVNLSGYSARMQIRQTHGSGVVFELTTSNGRIALGTTNGQITLSAAAVDTAALAAGLYIYDLELISPNGSVTRLLQGSVTVSPEVTRTT